MYCNKTAEKQDLNIETETHLIRSHEKLSSVANILDTKQHNTNNQDIKYSLLMTLPELQCAAYTSKVRGDNCKSVRMETMTKIDGTSKRRSSSR